MSFWKTKQYKSQKKRRCEWCCGKSIEIGTQYIRNTGLVDGDFQDYAMHLHCEKQCRFTLSEIESGAYDMGYLKDAYNEMVEEFKMIKVEPMEEIRKQFWLDMGKLYRSIKNANN